MSESPGRAQPSELHRAAAAAAAMTAIATSAPARRRGGHRTGVGRDGADAAEERDAAVSRSAVGLPWADRGARADSKGAGPRSG